MIPSSLAAALLLSGFVGLIAIAAKDIKKRVIPNGLVVFVAGIGVALRSDSELTSFGLSLLGAGLVFVTFALLAHRNFIGGGDAKLMAAATLLVPPDRILSLLLSIALAGGLLSCFYVAMHFFAKSARFPVRRFMGRLFWIPKRIKTSKSIPYALAVLGGATAYILSEVFECFNATSCSL